MKKICKKPKCLIVFFFFQKRLNIVLSIRRRWKKRGESICWRNICWFLPLPPCRKDLDKNLVFIMQMVGFFFPSAQSGWWRGRNWGWTLQLEKLHLEKEGRRRSCLNLASSLPVTHTGKSKKLFFYLLLLLSHSTFPVWNIDGGRKHIYWEKKEGEKRRKKKQALKRTRVGVLSLSHINVSLSLSLLFISSAD